MGLLAWWRRKFGKDVKTFSDDQKVEAYVTAGAEIGSAVSYIYMGECIGFDKLLDQWEASEKAYSDLGFRTLSIDDFTSYGGYGTEIAPLLRVPRKQGEPVILHAAYYRKHFFRRAGRQVDFDKVFKDGDVFTGTYQVPSTEHLKQE